MTEERAEGACIEPAHDPVVLALEDHRLLRERRLGRRDVVHAEPGRECTCHDKWYEDETGVLEPERHFPAGLLNHRWLAAKPAEHACGDHQRYDELHDGDAEVA